MNKLLIIVGIVLLNAPAVLACDSQMVTDASDHPSFSGEYSNNTEGKLGLPPGPGSPDSRSSTR